MLPPRVIICGGGNAAHLLIALLGSDKQTQLRVFAPFGDEAARLAADGGITARFSDTSIHGRAECISAHPEAVFPEADLVLLALPASAHAATLAAAAPYLPAHATVIALPARGGFDWEARALLPQRITLAGLQTLPWACRVPPGQYGRQVDVLGVKAVVEVATYPPELAPTLAADLTRWLSVPFAPTPSFLALTLANTGQLIHPGIMYGLFRDWDGTPFGEDTVPLFYAGVTEAIAAQLQAMSDEVQAVCRALLPQASSPTPHVSGQYEAVSPCTPLVAWLRRSYAADIADPSSLRTCFTTNRAYSGLRAPTILVEENALAPWFESRYLTEDVPFGLLVTRGLAELAGVETPAIDQVITWSQNILKQEWLVAGRLTGRHLAGTRTPQRFGWHTLDSFLADLQSPNLRSEGRSITND